MCYWEENKGCILLNPYLLTVLFPIPYNKYIVAITDPEIPLTSEDLLKLGEHHHEASDSIVTSGKGTRNKVDPQLVYWFYLEGGVSKLNIHIQTDFFCDNNECQFQNLIFKVNFLCQESIKSLWFFLSIRINSLTCSNLVTLLASVIKYEA